MNADGARRFTPPAWNTRPRARPGPDGRRRRGTRHSGRRGKCCGGARVEEDKDKELYELLERAAGLMVKAGYSGLNATVDVAGEEEELGVMEVRLYTHPQNPPPTLQP